MANATMDMQKRENRRGATLSMVDELLRERQEMWALYCQFSGKSELLAEKPVESVLRSFCQILIDYISLGHFGIYQRIADGNERRQEVVQVASDVYPQLMDLTDKALAFNDKYETFHPEAGLDTLFDDLSSLGENLAIRIELEDKLIASLVNG